MKVYGITIDKCDSGQIIKIKQIADLLVWLSPVNMPITKARKIAVKRALEAILNIKTDYGVWEIEEELK